MFISISIAVSGEKTEQRAFLHLEPRSRGKGLQLEEGFAVMEKLMKELGLSTEQIRMDITLNVQEYEYAAVVKAADKILKEPVIEIGKIKLSNREKSVILFTVLGMKQKQIAEKIHLTSAAVKQCRYRIYRKLGIKAGICSLMQIARIQGWLLNTTFSAV